MDLVLVWLSAFLLVWWNMTRLVSCSDPVNLGRNVIAAINCGGKEHTDVHGIHYKADPLKIGVASDFGSRLMIGRTESADMILYQTERYHHDDFSYEMDLSMEDGDYVLVLKFAEVYFQSAKQKVFDVLLNDEVIISHLDIFAKAGHGIALDLLVPFQVRAGAIHLEEGRVIPFRGRLKITLAKGEHDNPKLNAFYVLRGSVEDIPDLPPLMRDEEEDVPEPLDIGAHIPGKEDSERKLASGPPVADPYDQQDSTHTLLPVLVAIAAFLPLLFCLCKL